MLWGNLSQIVTVAGIAYFVSIMGIHLGLWMCRDRPFVRWGWWWLVFFAVEAIVLIVGGLAWGWQNLLLGLLLPVVVLFVDATLRRISFAPFHLQWWIRRYSRLESKIEANFKDFLPVQVFVLLTMVGGSTTIGWVVRDLLDQHPLHPNYNLLVVLLTILSFVAIAIATQTTLPHAAIDEARTHAKNLFFTTLDPVPDPILVLDQSGRIRQINQAAVELFRLNSQNLIGHHLSEFFSTLTGTPAQWSSRSEHILQVSSTRIVEFTISQSSDRKSQAYVTILRDITERKQAEADIRNALEK